MKRIQLALTLVTLGILSACKPAQKDPPFDYGYLRKDAKVDALTIGADNPIQIVGAPSLWPKTTGKLPDGNRVRIAVIGTGVDYTIPDLRDALWLNVGEADEKTRANSADDDGNGMKDDIIGYDFYSGDGLPYDWHGHDTFTASLIASTAKNYQAAGVVGVAPNAELMIVRYISPDGDIDSMTGPIDAAASIEYAVTNGARVIYFNYPEGGFGELSDLVVDAIIEAGKKNVLVVVPAGNSGNLKVAGFVRSLTTMAHVIIVAGLDAQGKILLTSNSGRNLATLAAPVADAVGYLPGNRVMKTPFETTSIAAAYVTGAAALVMSLPQKGSAAKVKLELMSHI